MSDVPEALRAVDRGLAVLAALADPGAPLSVSQVAAKVGFSRAAVRRVVLTLCELGYAVEDRPGRYLPSTNVLRLGWRSLALRSLSELARPLLRELAEETGHVAVLSRRLGIEILVEVVVAPGAVNIFHIATGDRLPPLTSESGRLLYTRQELDEPLIESMLRQGGAHAEAFLAALDAVAIDGHCLVDQEMEVGLVSLGVPVRGREGGVAAALSLYAYAGTTSPESLLTCRPLLRSAADRLEGDLQRGASAFAV